MVQLKVHCYDGTKLFIETLCVPILCSPLINQPTRNTCRLHNEFDGLFLADFSDGEKEGKKQIDILIGLDYYYNFMTGEVMNSKKEHVKAIGSHCGWIICGRFETQTDMQQHVNTIVLRADAFSTHTDVFPIQQRRTIEPSKELTIDPYKETIEAFWINEAVKDETCLEKDDNNYLFNREFEENLLFEDNRYSVKLPFKQHADTLPDNYSLALNRLHSLTKRMNEHKTKEYDDILQTYLKDGIIEKVKIEKDTSVGDVHYLSHRAVYKHDRETTKTRIVFDASAKNGLEPSLNEILYSGPCLLPYIFDILLRFRIGKFALVSDIKQAFLQIMIDPVHRNFLRFLWYEDLLTDNPILTVYRFTRVLFGLTSSPYLLNATVRCHMNKYKETFNELDLIEKFLRDLYVDDSTSSFKNEQEAKEFYTRIRIWLTQISILLNGNPMMLNYEIISPVRTVHKPNVRVYERF